MLGFNLLWILQVIVFIVLETNTYQLVSIWFVFGAIGALIASFCGVGFHFQVIIFVAVSLIMLAALRPISMKLVKKQNFKSNAEGLIGKDVLITEDVNNIKSTGQGKVDGMVWTVRSDSDEEIPKGTVVKIDRIEGVKLIVTK